MEVLLTGTVPAWQTMLVAVEVRKGGQVIGTHSLLTGTGPVWQTRVGLGVLTVVTIRQETGVCGR